MSSCNALFGSATLARGIAYHRKSGVMYSKALLAGAKQRLASLVSWSAAQRSAYHRKSGDNI